MKDDIDVKFNCFYQGVYKIRQKMEETEEEFIFQTISPFCDEVYEKRISKKELTEAILLYREVQSLEEMGIDPYGFMGKVQTTSDIAIKAYEEGCEKGRQEMKERIVNTMESLVGGGSDLSKKVGQFYLTINKREVKDKMSKVIIISSLSQENEIKKVADYYKKLGYIVDYPIKQSDKEFSRIVEDYLYRISIADIVVAITKSDGTFGTGVTYELAFARYLNKRIVVITDLDGGCLND